MGLSVNGTINSDYAAPAQQSDQTRKSSFNGKQAQDALSKYRNLWLSKGIKKYEMDFFIMDYTWVMPHNPLRAKVEDNVLKSLVSLRSSTVFEEHYDYTIDWIFDVIQKAIDGNAEEIDVQYDTVVGFPVSVNIDRFKKGDDDEFRFKVLHFKEIL